jgi:hypothetical protein
MTATDELLAGLLATAEEQLRWLRAAAMPFVRRTIENVLTKDKQRQAFELCDGTKTSTDVAKAFGVSKGTLSEWATNWRNLGIAYEVEGHKIKHLIGLSALGILLEAKTKAGEVSS